MAGLGAPTVTALAATLFGAEACGIAGWAVHTAAEYAKIRHQFGRPIGQFQAVKHRCAWMLTAAEQAAAAVWDAARARPAGRAATRGGTANSPPRWRPWWRSMRAVSCADECIQVLGGIGYTWEHDAHLYYRRALSLRALLGPSGEWARRVADLARRGRQPAAPGRPAGWRPSRCAPRSGRNWPRSAHWEPAARIGRLRQRRLGGPASAPAVGPGRRAP